MFVIPPDDATKRACFLHATHSLGRRVVILREFLHLCHGKERKNDRQDPVHLCVGVADRIFNYLDSSLTGPTKHICVSRVPLLRMTQNAGAFCSPPPPSTTVPLPKWAEYPQSGPDVVIPRTRGIQFCVPQNLRNNAE